jgi:hypothetical protein
MFPVENGVAPVAVIHPMINRAGILDSEFARHDRHNAKARHRCQDLYNNTIN